MSETNAPERLHKRIARSGFCSRRAAEELILAGRVSVNGAIVQELGVKVEENDVVRIDGEELETPALLYLAMNKPKGVVTTLSDPEGRRTVNHLLPELSTQVKPIGRLDKDSEGLLLFTNDGALAQRLTHPSFGIDKEYAVTVDGIVDEVKFSKLAKGIWIPEGGKTAPASITKIIRDTDTSRTHFHITIHEGRKRQIRLMGEAIGHRVRVLKRVRIGPVQLQSLPKGICRMLAQKEIDDLFAAVRLERNVKPARRRRNEID